MTLNRLKGLNNLMLERAVTLPFESLERSKWRF
jgi:hypothetical protein